MRYSRIVGWALSGALALILAACGATPAKHSPVQQAADSGNAGVAGNAAWNAREPGLQEQLRIRLAASDATVSPTHEGLSVRLPAATIFAADSIVLLPEGRFLLDQLAQTLNGSGFVGTRLAIAVYDDLLGDPTPAHSLAAGRALAVVELLKQEGVAGGRIQIQSAPGTRTPVSNDTPEQRRADRRLEIQISPLSF
jgi:outer membrane protein OmpA-like peptidoglycan-associated protein